MTRRLWVTIHRWAGLAMAGFLIVVGLTWSSPLFDDELLRWLESGGVGTRHLGG